MKTIEFFSFIPGVADACPIVHAKDARPKWMSHAREDYKKTLDTNNARFNHIYQCPGIFEMYKHGFIVPLWSDVIIQTDSAKKGFGWATAIIDHKEEEHRILIDRHDDEVTKVIPPRPYSLPYVIKINSPWNVVAPKGLKFLMLPISYPDSHEFDNAIGILDPAVSCEINFQLWWNVKDGETVIKAGTPMVHLIPLTEEKYELICRDMNAHDKVWLEKRRYLNYFTFRPRRNLIKEFYNKHFNKE
jgi:hypothetical protein